MPSPSDYSNESDFISACIKQRQDEHPSESTEQSAAICYSMWGEKNAKNVVHKTHSAEVQQMEFVLSDETIDRYGDVIVANGWDTRDFVRNPVALFNHNPDAPIGKWSQIRIADGALKGKLELAPEGTSARIDEIRRLVDAGILRAVSVGFRPIESQPISKTGAGTKYTKSALLECSLVSVPANPNALAIAKGLRISDDVKKLVFGESADRKTDIIRRGSNGKSADRNVQIRKAGQMSTPISQRITERQTAINADRDKLSEHLKTVDDANPTDEQTTITEELTLRIEQGERQLEMLQKAEKALAVRIPDQPRLQNGGDTALMVKHDRPFAVAAKKVNPIDYMFRALTVKVKHNAERGSRSMVDVLKGTYGEDEGTKAIMDAMITRTASTVATTTTATWAQELVTVAVGDFMDLLQPVSIYARLAALGGRFTFGPNGMLSIPARTSTATVGGAFVAQGGVIPVKKASFTAITLTPKKAAVISTFTRELAEHSTPSIEALLRDAIVNDTATAIDAILMDTNAATTTRPAGLGFGLSTQTPNVGTDLAGVIGDVKTMTNALFSGTNGNVRTPVWIMPPGYANGIALSTISSTGIMPFREEIGRGQLAGYPVIQSTNTIPADTIWLLDAADFVTATGDVPRFDVSDTAVLAMEDTTPLDVVTGGTVNTGTVKSMYQTDSLAIRMILDINWSMRRSGVVMFMTGVNWQAP